MGRRKDNGTATWGKVFITLEGRAAAQRDLDMLEKCAKTSLMTFSDSSRGGIMPFINTCCGQPVVKQFCTKGLKKDLSRLY